MFGPPGVDGNPGPPGLQGPKGSNIHTHTKLAMILRCFFFYVGEIYHIIMMVMDSHQV